MTIAPSLRRLAGLGLNAEQLAAALSIIADILDDATATAGRAMTGAERMQRHRLRHTLGELQDDVRVGDDAVTKSSPNVTPQSDIVADSSAGATSAGGDGGRQLAIARKALTVAGLSGNAVRVGAALLDRCNRHSGRCDPGLSDLASLLHREVRHVRRGVRELERAGLLMVKRHGGAFHANAYTMQFERMAAVVARFETMSALPVTARHVEPDQSDRFVLQTQKKIHTSTRGVRSNAPARGRDFRQRELLLPMSGGQTAAQQAKVRLILALDAHLLRFGPRFADQAKADLTADAWDNAVRTEINRRGSGLDVLLETLGPGQATGPPVASAAG